jgi:hypothetical protein
MREKTQRVTGIRLRFEIAPLNHYWFAFESQSTPESNRIRKPLKQIAPQVRECVGETECGPASATGCERKDDAGRRRRRRRRSSWLDPRWQARRLGVGGPGRGRRGRRPRLRWCGRHEPGRLEEGVGHGRQPGQGGRGLAAKPGDECTAPADGLVDIVEPAAVTPGRAGLVGSRLDLRSGAGMTVGTPLNGPGPAGAAGRGSSGEARDGAGHRRTRTAAESTRRNGARGGAMTEIPGHPSYAWKTDSILPLSVCALNGFTM